MNAVGTAVLYLKVNSIYKCISWQNQSNICPICLLSICCFFKEIIDVYTY